MEVILLEKIRSLGNLGEKVKVKAGYGRNYLIPYAKAVPATKENIAVFEEKRAELEKKAQHSLEAAKARADKLKGLKLTISAMASEEGKLYGSVSTTDISRAIRDAGHQIEKREIDMPQGAIHSVGEYEILLHLHTDVSIPVMIEVVPSK